MSSLGVWAKPVLRGPTVTLRPYEAADLDAAWEMAVDPVVATLTGTTEIFTRAHVRDWVESRAAAPERLDLVIEDNVSGDFAGEIVVNEHDAAASSANIRIALRGPEWFGRGMGTEAIGLVSAHVFEVIGLARLTLDVRADNRRAIRAYERHGFVETARVVEDGVAWVDMALANPRGTGGAGS